MSDNNKLVPGIVIKTKFPSSDVWITNTIKSVNQNSFSIPLKEDYFKEGSILNEDTIIVEFSDDEYEYKIDGKIIDIDILNTQTMTIQIINFLNYKNKRKSVRYYINWGASIYSPTFKKRLPAIVTNVSMTGICFVCKHFINTDSYLTIDVLLPNNEIKSFAGYVVRSKECQYGFEHAIELDSNDFKTVDNMFDLINFINSEIDKNHNDTKSFLNATILLVDGSNLIRKIVKNVMNNIGITNILEASNSNETLKLVKLHKPDIVCMSYIIYEIENKNILDQLYSENPNIKIIFLSSTPKDEIDPNLLYKYKIDYISKCSDFRPLIETIKKYSN